MVPYIYIFLASVLTALAITPLIARLARRMRILDEPGVRRVHTSPVPRVGGVAIVVAAVVPVLVAMTRGGSISPEWGDSRHRLMALLVAAGFIFVVGLIDDVRGVRARWKLAAQLAAALGLCAAGIRIDSIRLDGLLDLNFGWWAWPITVLWIVGITNAVNMIDGLDGLAGGIAAVACGLIAVFAFYSGNSIMAYLMLAMLGSLLGFLVFNFHPARIFMGDCGSMFLGFVLAAASVLCAVKSATIVGMALPALALGVPIFDTFFAILRRFLRRQSVFTPDRGHIHHLLLDAGLSHKHAVLVMYAATLLAAGLGTFMMIARGTGSIAVFASVSILLLLGFRLVGAWRLRESIASLRRNMAIAASQRRSRRDFEEAALHLTEAKTSSDWWRSVCLAAEKLELINLTLLLPNRDGSVRKLVWEGSNGQSNRTDEQGSIHVTSLLHQRRLGRPVRIEAEAVVDDSMESAGRRLVLIGRLIDEHPHPLAATPYEALAA